MAKENEKDNLPAVADAGAQYMALQCSDEELAEYADIFRDNTEGEILTERDLPRCSVPPQGMKVWNVPTAEGPKVQESIRGIIVKVTTPRAMWPASMDEGGSAPPICSSPDSIKGVGKPGGDCLSCPFNAWDSAPNGSGKACKEKRMIYVLQKDSILPTVVQAPSTSIQNVKEYRMNLAGQKLHYYGVETELTLERIEGKFPYSRTVLRNVGELSTEQRNTVRGYINAFGPMFQKRVEFTPDEESALADNQADNQANNQVVEGSVAGQEAGAEAQDPADAPFDGEE
jgi:hypothetical protein